MTRPRSATYHYSIDREDRLTAVSNAWVGFADENDAPELTRDFVLHRRIWDFVDGVRTREVYEVLFRWVREHQAVLSIPLRCDSPDRIRHMLLTLSPSVDGGIDMAGILEDEHPRAPLKLFDRLVPRADYAFPVCSFCRRVFAFGSWLEPEEAVKRLGWLESGDPPEIEDDVCQECRRKARAAVQADTPA